MSKSNPHLMGREFNFASEEKNIEAFVATSTMKNNNIALILFLLKVTSINFKSHQ